MTVSMAYGNVLKHRTCPFPQASFAPWWCPGEWCAGCGVGLLRVHARVLGWCRRWLPNTPERFLDPDSFDLGATHESELQVPVRPVQPANPVPGGVHSSAAAAGIRNAARLDELRRDGCAQLATPAGVA